MADLLPHTGHNPVQSDRGEGYSRVRRRLDIYKTHDNLLLQRHFQTTLKQTHEKQHTQHLRQKLLANRVKRQKILAPCSAPASATTSTSTSTSTTAKVKINIAPQLNGGGASGPGPMQNHTSSGPAQPHASTPSSGSACSPMQLAGSGCSPMQQKTLVHTAATVVATPPDIRHLPVQHIAAAMAAGGGGVNVVGQPMHQTCAQVTQKQSADHKITVSIQHVRSVLIHII